MKMDEKNIKFIALLEEATYLTKAGKDAIDSETIISLMTKINEGLSYASKKNNNPFLRRAADLWAELFELIVDNQIADIVTESIHLDSFYAFGKALERYYQIDKYSLNRLTYAWLDIFRQSNLLQRLKEHKQWEKLVADLIIKSNFNVSELLKQRVRSYGEKTLFRALHTASETNYSWSRISNLIKSYRKGITSLIHETGGGDVKIAFLLENSIEMVVFDLACLTSGIVNIMIPANSVPQQIDFILNQTKAELVLAMNDKQLAKIKSIKNKLPHLKKVVLIQGSSIENWVMSKADLIAKGEHCSDETIEYLQSKIKINALATIMYTSGTTGDPKGIMFSNMNIVYKRFCRAMALPKVSDKSRFLSYLPLFHTFGRWLEMIGAIFWGAEYAFMANPALFTMINNMQRVKPTIFISIPKKWYQLYEYISGKVDIELAPDDEIRAALGKYSGGALEFGLSAAGYLDPDIFKFFQRYGIELMSGFGMTEATGGITMTYPGEYVENSLGKPLPGIAVRLAADGEMMISGQYVMKGYFAVDDHNTFVDGWFPTGDIMKQDRNGYYEIIDRKKEIYKNIKGETIAPQKIENLFRDFDYVEQVFLVGDHKQFNTVLIYPNYRQFNERLSQMSREELLNYFASVVVTVNKFLAPFERIINFRIIHRAFSAEKGELTPKGTYKRRVIEKNFKNVYNEMYLKNYLTLFWKDTEIRLPNWFLREIGCLTGDVKIVENGIEISKYDKILNINRHPQLKNVFRIGDYYYKIQNTFLDFQSILANPFYWLGNRELIDFAGETIFQWYRLDEPIESIQLYAIAESRKIDTTLVEKFIKILEGKEKSLFGLNLAVIHLQSPLIEESMNAVQYLELILNDDALPIYKLALSVCSLPHFGALKEIRKNMFRLGIQAIKNINFEEYLKLFLRKDYQLLDDDLILLIAKTSQKVDLLPAIHNVLTYFISGYRHTVSVVETAIPALLNLLSVYGMVHPTKYKQVRKIIVHYQLKADMPEVQKIAGKARAKLLTGFRNWLGENQEVAVDVETGAEYTWKDVIIFEENVEEAEKLNLLNAITETSILREAIFLFTNGAMVRLYDIPLGGVWVSVLYKNPQKAVYRVSVQTRFQGSFDLAFNTRFDTPHKEVRTEINWLIHSSYPSKGIRLTEDFGGYWKDYNIWSEEYVYGDSVAEILEKEKRKGNEENNRRMYHLWPFFIWNAMAAHISFWERSDYKIELEDKTPDNMIIASHDYQTEIRIKSISKRKNAKSFAMMIKDFYEQFIERSHKKFAFIKRDDALCFIFRGVIEAEGEEKGVQLLKTLKNTAPENDGFMDEKFHRQLKLFLGEIETTGFVPKQLYFASQRFLRWQKLNRNASLSAQAKTMNEIYETYRLHQMEEKLYDTRTRFFYNTVFKSSKKNFKDALITLMAKQTNKKLDHEKTLQIISNIHKEFQLNEKEKFFISRLSYPHLKPTDSAALVSSSNEGATVADVVVRLEDYQGETYLVRKPVSPKEISRLHKLFLEVNLPVTFHPDHKFLVAVSKREHIIGGLFYNYTNHNTVYMEKIVVASHYRRKGVSEGVMNEFFNRLKDEHIHFVTTGFFRPEYFYRFGFKIEKKYSGLVKNLNERHTESNSVVT
jgi:long-subunit acyl-CoA synthetase (AMP-forming)